MRHPAKIAIALASVLIGSLMAIPAAPAAAPAYGEVEVEYIVPTKHGDIFVEVFHPTLNDKIVKSPTVLTYSPYSALGRNGDRSRWVPRGYSRAYADVVGTGNSGGCWDYGGNREKETGAAIVQWIGKQNWSTGKVGMIGGSYEGTTATATATQRPKALKTIVPQAAISRWYGYAFAGGIRYSVNNEKLGEQGPTNGVVVDEQGFDTPLAFDFGFAAPPPLDPQNPRWAERVQSSITPCDELKHIQSGYDYETPDYDAFWKERDYLKDARKIRIPVLVSHNWGDWNVKQDEGFNLYKALKNSRRRVMYFGTRWENHGNPSNPNYTKTVDRWMDFYLMGKGSVRDIPPVITQTSDFEGPGKYFFGKMPKTKPLNLIAQGTVETDPNADIWKLLPFKPDRKEFGSQLPSASFPSAGINTESHAMHHAPNNHDWRWFQSPPLAKDVRIFGEIKIKIYSQVQRRWITFTPTIVDYNPGVHEQLPGTGDHYTTDGRALVGMTRGWLDSRYRRTLAKQAMLTPGKPFEMTVVAKPQDYVFKKGHSIGLNIQTEINEWSMPKTPDCGGPDCVTVVINWIESKTRIIVPVVGGFRGSGASLFTGLSAHRH